MARHPCHSRRADSAASCIRTTPRRLPCTSTIAISSRFGRLLALIIPQHQLIVLILMSLFRVEDPKKPGVPKAWWFGGGSDLTPSYLFPVDAEHFHTSVAEECDSPEQYKRFKTWCDEYFRIKHRGESRGLGGIFFDDLSAAPGDIEGREKLFDFVKRSGEGFVKSYVPIVARRTHADFTERMRQWQQLRRVCSSPFPSNMLAH